MKKILFLFLLGIFISGFCVAFGYSELDKSAQKLTSSIVDLTLSMDKLNESLGGESAVKKMQNFYSKLGKCTPTKFVVDENTKYTVYGKTKGGQCRYSYTTLYQNEVVPVQCVAPVSVVLGYASTLSDMYDEDYTTRAIGLKEERTKQYVEISQIMNDYCRIIKKK